MQHKRIATAFSDEGVGDMNCFELCRKTNSQNFGNVGRYQSEKEQYEDLKHYQIDYFLYTGCSKTDKYNHCISRDTLSYIKGKIPIFVLMSNME